MLDDLVKSYLDNEALCIICEEDLPKAKSLKHAIQIAAMSRDKAGKKLSHQRRVPEAVLSQLRDALFARIEQIKSCSCFESLHCLVVDDCVSIHGAGPLTAYDVAFRIGLFQGYKPETVHLHAGTLKGARKLGFNGKSILMSNLPKALQNLEPYQVEDFLCIYKDRLNKHLQ